ncbi:MAG: inorganic diphosphatase [Chitinophagaceae bacterium]|nr:inorganic diphosphatase [Chitinophagaceae bacterium]
MKAIKVIIETPKGSTEKYRYDKDDHFFEMAKVLPAGMVFPYDFGFIPDTKGEDGDPLDVIVISEFKSFPGCLMHCRIIGAFIAEQSEKKNKKKMVRNDRYLAIPESSGIFSGIRSIDDLPAQIVKELETFFGNYNELEKKKFKPLGILNPDKALDLIRKSWQ